MNRSMTDHIVVKRHLLDEFTATQTPSTGVDVSDLAKAEVIVNIGPMANAAASPQPSWTFALQHSDTSNANFEAVAAADVVIQKDGDALASGGVFATVDAADEDDKVYRIGYVGGKRYVRVVATAANTPGATPIDVIVLGEPRLKPGSDS